MSSVALTDVALAAGRWRRRTRWGTVAETAFDEDVVTLSARAGLEVLDRNEGLRPSALVVATVSAPLPEPGAAPFLSEVFDLQEGGEHPAAEVIELGGSVSAGLAAISVASGLVAGGLDPVMVVLADDRRDAKGRSLGAAAVALLVGAEGDVARFEMRGVGTELFLDRWQHRGGSGVHVGDRSMDRFSPARRFAAKAFGEDDVVVSSAAGPTIERIGFPGNAAPIVSALSRELADGSSRRVVSSAGGISRALELTAGPGFDIAQRRVAAEIEGGMDGAPARRPDESAFDPYYSQPAAFRERAQTYRLEGARDPESGQIFFPAPPGAGNSGLVAHRLRRSGVVHTFAKDHVYPVGSPLSMAVVDVDGGGRFYGQVADGVDVAIGDRVSLVLRRLHEGGGVPNYFWKVLPSEERLD